MLGQAAREVAALVTKAGVTAYVDAEQARPPCAIVLLSDIAADTLGTTHLSATWDIALVGPEAGVEAALDEVGGMLRSLLEAGLPLSGLVPGTVTLYAVGSQPLPAIVATLETEVS